MPKLISVKEAKEQDLKRYFTGKPCINNHICERRLSDNHCIECTKARQRKENRTEEQRQYKNLCHRNYMANLSEKDKEKWKQYYNQWARENPDKRLKKARKWRSKNRNKMLSYAHKRRAGEGLYTDQDIRRIFHDQFGKCNGCNRNFSEQLKYTIDHVVSLSKGGTNWPDNIQLLCGSCNYSKGSKTMDEWLKFRTIL